MILVLAFSISLVGCYSTKVVVKESPGYESEKKGPPPWAPAHGHRAKYRYHYYPSAYVYFDVGRRLYFYFQDDQWRVSASLPVGIRIATGEYVVLEMDTDRPYQFHSDVEKRYPPGQLKKSDKGKGKGKWN
ncbi:MAG: hypothetical protein HXY46_05725 [Syntrophaceae bacterium]|nr:hypothetical protein [Syntrophaceae bacterium]